VGGRREKSDRSEYISSDSIPDGCGIYIFREKCYIENLIIEIRIIHMEFE
jgi:hypothetical protein